MDIKTRTPKFSNKQKIALELMLAGETETLKTTPAEMINMEKIININRYYMRHALKSIVRDESINTVFRIWGDKGGIWISKNYD